MANTRVVSSLDDVDTALHQLQITTTAQVGQVQFQLDEEAPLRDAANLMVKTRPGRHGFNLVNPELLECMFRAKMALETSFSQVLNASIQRIDQELQPIENSIAVLRVRVAYNDNQIPQHGPQMDQRNRGLQHHIYPCPPFPTEPNPEYDADPQKRVPYLPPYATQQERDAAAALDRRAQMAVWQAKLRILEVRRSILKQVKNEMLSKMNAEFTTIMEQRSNLGAGFADYEFPPLA